MIEYPVEPQYMTQDNAVEGDKTQDVTNLTDDLTVIGETEEKQNNNEVNYFISWNYSMYKIWKLFYVYFTLSISSCKRNLLFDLGP